MASVGEIVGFSILIAGVVLFVIAIAIYGICLQCCKKEPKSENKSKAKKRDENKVKSKKNRKSGEQESNEPCAGDVAWHNPLVELENVLDEEEQKIEEASQLGSEIQTSDSGYQNGTLERQQPEILEEEPDYIRNSKVYPTVDTVNETEPKPVTSSQIVVVEHSPEVAPADTLERREVRELASASKPVTSQIESIQKSSEAAVVSDTLERREAKDLTRSNSILNRVSYFESANNSLVRPAKQGKEGIRGRVVTGLVSDFEKSDKVILGRQAPEIDIHIMQEAIAKKLNTGDPDAAEDPLYAVPDRSRKSQNRKSRPDSHMSEGSEQSLPTPQVPSKPEDL